MRSIKPRAECVLSERKIRAPGKEEAALQVPTSPPALG